MLYVSKPNAREMRSEEFLRLPVQSNLSTMCVYTYMWIIYTYIACHLYVYTYKYIYSLSHICVYTYVFVCVTVPKEQDPRLSGGLHIYTQTHACISACMCTHREEIKPSSWWVHSLLPLGLSLNSHSFAYTLELAHLRRASLRSNQGVQAWFCIEALSKSTSSSPSLPAVACWDLLPFTDSQHLWNFLGPMKNSG